MDAQAIDALISRANTSLNRSRTRKRNHDTSVASSCDESSVEETFVEQTLRPQIIIKTPIAAPKKINIVNNVDQTFDFNTIFESKVLKFKELFLLGKIKKVYDFSGVYEFMGDYTDLSNNPILIDKCVYIKNSTGQKSYEDAPNFVAEIFINQPNLLDKIIGNQTFGKCMLYYLIYY